MAASQAVLIDVAGAILDGAQVDWASAESGVEASDRALLDPLRVVSVLADVHRRLQEPPQVAPVTAHLRVVPPRSPQREHWGHLRVLERIGRGAFGEVYRAWDTRLDREVALKVMAASAASNAPRATTIIEEGRLLARVRHPNVVTIYGAERIGDEVGLWMEFVKGVTVAQALEQGRTFSTSEALAIGTQLCSAIAAVHGAGLLHRDIKAQNVMLADEGRVVLMDFGTGRELGDGSPPGLAGTPLYLAPELLTGAEPTVRSDIYSVGVFLYHLFTSSFPLTASTFPELQQAHARGERLGLGNVRPDLSWRLTAVIERALDPQPERRQPNALALAGELTAITRRPRLIPFAVALAIATVAALVAWGTIGTRDRVAPRVSPAAGLAGAAAAVMERPVIAVLPLKNLSAEPDSDYFVDGLTDEIIRNLAVVEGLEVRSRTSSFAFKDQPRNLHEVGEQLGVNLVVEGSVMRSGSRLRINAQLVQIAGDVPVWAERFDRELKDVFAIQDEISRAIVNKLRLTVGGGQRRYDTNLQAYELYLKARELVDRRSALPAQQAIKLFQQAIASDPSFALAYAGLADAYAAASEQIPGSFGDLAIVLPERALELIGPAAQTALQLDPLLAEAHAAMGLLYSRKLDWRNAEESFRRAIDLNPTLTHIYATYSTSTLVPLGKLAEAEQLLQRALQSDPLSLNVQRELAWQRLLTGRYGEAVESFQRILAIDPHFPYVVIPLARALTFGGRPAEALRVLGPHKEKPGYQHWMAHAYVLVGQRAEVERLAATHDDPFRLAVIYAALGDRDRAFEALDRAVVRIPHRVAVDLLREPEMAALRGDPRFEAVRRKLGLP